MPRYANSKLTIIKTSVAILIIATFATLGYLIGIATNNTINHYRLYPGWIPITDPPVPIANLLTPTDGYMYLKGTDGKIYRTCTTILDNPKCWQEIDFYNPPEPESCSWIDEMQSPPENTTNFIIHCLAPEFVNLNGIALTQNGEIYGFYGESHPMGSLIQGIWIILIALIISIAAAIIVIIKILPRVGYKRLGK